ncbi:MAG: PAS domain-containing protein [Oceanospirillaceae bacterium]|nr:PAS domain-containing protein [Oceanospirillaceae bacterium]
MSFSLSLLISIVLAYLFVLFFTAYVVEKGWLPSKIVHHPAIYVLSLGVYASAWAFYGTVGMAHEYGYAYLAYYLGISGAFVLSPVLLKPILRITRTYQLTSLADLFAFRFRSRAAGAIVTIFMLAAVMPLLALQITAVADTFYLLNQDFTRSEVALGYCLVMTLFAILFGARHVSPREKHEGLVFAIAFESLLKLVALCIIGGVALFGVFGGPEGLNSWLTEHHHQLTSLQATLQEGPWRTLLLVFFAAAVVMPHMFHMAFTENLNVKALQKASWGMPLFLLIMALMVPPILWAGFYLAEPTPPEYFAMGLGLALDSTALTTTAFVGGLAAASGIMIVTTLALAAMAMNHLVLPVYQPRPRQNFYRWLLWVRRWLIATILIGSWVFYATLGQGLPLERLGIVAFVATLQFLPGVLGVLYWPSGNRQGFISGLIAGVCTWVWAMLLPLLGFASDSYISPFLPAVDESNWHLAAMGSIFVNLLVFLGVSGFTRTRPVEVSSAEACSIDTLSRPQRLELTMGSSEEFIASLTEPLGERVAEREVHQALTDLQLPNPENRPFALRRLRTRLEANLSGLMGPSVAHRIVHKYIPYKDSEDMPVSQDIHLIEKDLEHYQNRLTGLAAELDNLRRFHRQTVERLPMGACNLGADGEILMWNSVLAELTGIAADDIVGSRLQSLAEPWRSLLTNFIADESAHLHKKTVEIGARPRWFNLHKATLQHPANQGYGGLIILIEDQTETQLLEDELIHSERLASIGRLAAGVAHEIGNPITGIACLAQNLKYETDNTEVIEVGEQILDQTKRVSRIVQGLVNFAHAGRNNALQGQEPVNIHLCVQDAIDLLELSNRGKELQFINHTAQDLQVLGNEQRLQQVFVNLLGNARDASEDGSSITVSSESSELSVVVHVEDQGSGIAPDVIDRIFEPFFTTKEVGKGTGLGLALVYSIIEEHYGHISIESPANPEKHIGTRVTLTLPRYQARKVENEE